MQFRLLYEGPLKANGSIAHKQDIRRYLHRQLAVLWKQPPLLDNYDSLLDKSEDHAELSILKEVNQFSFAPLVSSALHLVAELHIVFLRPETPGALITQGGDIDNRLKTLFDALRMPKIAAELPIDDDPGPDETPFFCLLEDDNLITSISVETDRLLRLSAANSDVYLVIAVKTQPVAVTWANLWM